jgi:hypothetical protein
MRLAEENDIDLVEIAPTAKPPVCRLMDYGKFKYRESKKAHEAKLKQKQIQVKEVKFRPGTDEGDYKIKVRNLTRFLTEGDKTKVTLRFRAARWPTRSWDAAPQAGRGRPRGSGSRGAVAQARRAPDGDDPGPEEEARSGHAKKVSEVAVPGSTRR